MKKIIITPNTKAKDTIKEAMLMEFNTAQNRKKPFFSRVFNPRQTFVASLVLVLFIGTFFAINLVPTPLNADQVIAGALQSIDEKQSARWLYTKTKEETTYGNKKVVTISEGWSDTKFVFPENGSEVTDNGVLVPNSSYKTTLLDGRILNEYVSVDGKNYERDTREVVKEIMGYDPYDMSSYASSDTDLIPGYEEAGITLADIQTKSLKEIDDMLVAAGLQPVNSVNYKSIDFPAYTMSPAELEELYRQYDSIIAEDRAFFDNLYGGQDNYRTDITYTSEGELLSGDEATAYNEQLKAAFETQEKLRNGTLEEKKAALEKLRSSESVSLIRDIEWEGIPVLGLNLSQINSFGTGAEMTYMLYLDEKSFRIVGEEFSYDFGDDESISSLNNGISPPSSVKITYLEQFSTNIEPNFSIEGLVSSETLYVPAVPATEAFMPSEEEARAL
jgi:hypothetical protein